MPHLARPRRLVGIHFFNPVAQMPLVEVVGASGTDQEAVSAACAFVRHIEQIALAGGQRPRLSRSTLFLAPYLREALLAVDEGVDPAALDAALVAFGMPRGRWQWPIRSAWTSFWLPGGSSSRARRPGASPSASPGGIWARRAGAASMPGRRTGRARDARERRRPALPSACWSPSSRWTGQLVREGVGG